MHILGITDRVPKALSITTPWRSRWRLCAEEKKGRDFANLPEYMLPDVVQKFPRYKMPKKIRGRPLEIHESKNLGQSEQLRSPVAKVSTIGQVFLDMLAAPQLCGGMPHVIEVSENDLEPYVKDLIPLVDQDKRPIVKVRAGYLLAEKFGITDRRIENWKSFAQRGGSRKLDPLKPYGDQWSDAWQIALNI